MDYVKAEYLEALNKNTNNVEKVKFIPPSPEGDDLGGVSEKYIEDTQKNIEELADKKIAKFYASNQGETNLADSDNGKIQDMMIYGKSSQDGTPTPENPVEIKSVVNPTVKIVGKNLLKATLQTTTKNGVTCTANGDGTYTLNGTATSQTSFWLIGAYNNNIKIPLNPTKKYVLKGTGYSSVQLHAGTADHTSVSADGKDIILTNMAGIAFVLVRINNDITVNNLIIYPQLEEGFIATTYEPYKPVQTVILPYTLNAIPVSADGNVTIGGQQYVADYVDVERGKLVRRVGKKTLNGTEKYVHIEGWNDNAFAIYEFLTDGVSYKNYTDVADIISDKLAKNAASNIANNGVIGIGSTFRGLFICLGDGYNTVEKIKEYFSSNNTDVYYVLNTPTETDLTSEEITAFKALTTYYPVTNISVNSEQLDGHTVFNYPVSMANGWNYVKQQLNDNRDYIYDMDIQSAEAYVNSEYAVALTELEV